MLHQNQPDNPQTNQNVHHENDLEQVITHTTTLQGSAPFVDFNSLAARSLGCGTHLHGLLGDVLQPALEVTIDSHGERNPLVPTDDGIEEARNRRVEVTIR